MVEGGTVGAQGHHARILVVDDEEPVRMALQRILEKEEYDVECAGSGSEAMEKATEHVFDVVITDLVMPGIDGLALVGRLHDENPRMKVIVLTAFGGWDSYSGSLRAGAYDFVVKPAKKDAIVRVVQRALGESSPPAPSR